MENKTIDFELVVPRFFLFRFDILPFIFLYSFLVWVYYQVDEDSDANIYIRLAIIGVGFLNCLTYIFGHWSKKAQAVIQYRKIGTKSDMKENLQKASHVYTSEKK